MRITYLLICLFTGISLSVSAQKKKAFSASKAHWIIGGWQGTANSKPFYEGWKEMNDSTLVNFTIEINGTDTIVKENGMLCLSKSQGFFQGNSAKWDVAALTGSKIELVNDKLNYANRIVWTRSKKDHWLTYIENPGGKLNYDLVRTEWVDRAVDNYVARAVNRK